MVISYSIVLEDTLFELLKLVFDHQRRGKRHTKGLPNVSEIFQVLVTVLEGIICVAKAYCNGLLVKASAKR